MVAGLNWLRRQATAFAYGDRLSRLPAPNHRLSTALPIGFDKQVRLIFDSADAFREHSIATLNRMKSASRGDAVNALVLSGGGAGGAFGAGALVGLSRGGHRPIYHMVTGVSAGALIAPLAFLGADWDPALTETITRDITTGFLERQLRRVLVGSSLYSGSALRQVVDHIVTDELIDAIASESRHGRMLLVETTDLDKGESVIWDMGAIAERGGVPARELFRDVLLASASIPFVFPPVLIRVTEDGNAYDEMHVDGGTSMQLFLAPPVGILLSRDTPRLDGVNVYVIANSQLGRIPATSPMNAMSMLSRGFYTNLRQGVRSSLAIVYAFSKDHDMGFKVTSIPDNYPFSGPLDFDTSRMRALFDFAVNRAASGHLWRDPVDAYHHAMTTPAREFSA